MVVDAIVTAGGVPQPGEPLYPYAHGQSKALLEICGRPLVQWVLDALSGAETIRQVVVLGLSAAEAAPLHCAKPLQVFPDQGGLLENVQAGVAQALRSEAPPRHVLLVSSDIPAITPAVINWSVTTSLQTDHEAYYSLIPRAVMEQQFPGSKRSFFYFQDGVFTGGDMNLIATRVLGRANRVWTELIASRKNALKQAGLIGWDVLALFAARQLTTAQTARLVCQRLQIDGRLLICPHAEVGMDVDKPGQYELVKQFLEKRAARESQLGQ